MDVTFMTSTHHLPMKRLHFVFRLDAGRQFGNGHFMRSMVLCTELLGRGHSVAILSQSMPQPLQALLLGQHIHLYLIDPQSDGVSELAAIHQAQSIDWLVIDHYGIDIRWESAARPFTSKIMVIDDLANRHHDCDFLLDQNEPNRIQKQYAALLPQHCVVAIGWSNLLARPEFYDKGLQERSGILVFLGGGDHSEVLSACIEKLLALPYFHPLKVLVSSDYMPLAHWQAQLSNHGQAHCDLPNPAPLYISAKLAVVRCGFVSYELALLGIPAVNIYSSPVQSEVAHALERFGAGIALASDHLSDPDRLDHALQRAACLTPEPLNVTLRPGANQVANFLEKFHEHR
jgi:UDP-2,4-diacetamido-2,4,6-trideoxy-beta-L-altropyranose hydrolase